MNEDKIEQIRRVLVEEAQSDAVGLWAVLWEVQHSLPVLAPDQAKSVTLEVVRGALLSRRVVAGQFDEGDGETSSFVPWHVSVEDAIFRIAQGWASLNREPILGEIAWFVSPLRLPFALNVDPRRKESPLPREVAPRPHAGGIYAC